MGGSQNCVFCNGENVTKCKVQPRRKHATLAKLGLLEWRILKGHPENFHHLPSENYPRCLQGDLLKNFMIVIQKYWQYEQFLVLVRSTVSDENIRFMKAYMREMPTLV